MTCKIKITFFLVLATFQLQAQIGGSRAFAFLNLPASARVAALGGSAIAIDEVDINLAAQNPALLQDANNEQLTMNYTAYFAGVNMGYMAYAFRFKNYGNFLAGITYLNYGEFIKADATGLITGTFTAADYSFQLAWSKKIDSLFTVGVSAKPIYSHLETYSSLALAFDAAILYRNRAKQFSATLLLRNAGFQLKPYYEAHYEPLPFEIMLAVAKRLKHAPFRISLVAGNLQRWDLRYPELRQNSFFQTEKQQDFVYHLDNLLRHITVGLEFIPTKNFTVRLGYNHLRKRELELYSYAGLTGFSWGFAFQISKFQFSYGRAIYHAAGASNYFSFGTKLSEFFN